MYRPEKREFYLGFKIIKNAYQNFQRNLIQSCFGSTNFYVNIMFQEYIKVQKPSYRHVYPYVNYH